MNLDWLLIGLALANRDKLKDLDPAIFREKWARKALAAIRLGRTHAVKFFKEALHIPFPEGKTIAQAIVDWAVIEGQRQKKMAELWRELSCMKLGVPYVNQEKAPGQIDRNEAVSGPNRPAELAGGRPGHPVVAPEGNRKIQSATPTGNGTQAPARTTERTSKAECQQPAGTAVKPK